MTIFFLKKEKKQFCKTNKKFSSHDNEKSLSQFSETAEEQTTNNNISRKNQKKTLNKSKMKPIETVWDLIHENIGKSIRLRRKQIQRLEQLKPR
jgi:hypothetical protein